MKTITLGGGPDFYSCLETLNLVLWVSKDINIDFAPLETLLHHDHPTWVDPRVLATYFDMFIGLRGAGLGLWTANIAIAYDKGLAIAKVYGAF
jgi:hypothetical protein